MSKKKVVGFIAAGLVVGAVILFGSLGSQMKNLVFTEIDMSEIGDGIYQGSAETSLVKVEVEIEVQSHEIIRVDLLKHDNGLGAKAEAIVDDIISENTYEVDEISGATMSSQVIKSAVNDALVKGRER